MSGWMQDQIEDANQVEVAGWSGSRYQRRDRDVRVQELDEEALIFDVRSADTHHLNRTAYFVWRACDGLRDLATIADGLCTTYDVPREEAKQHVQRIMGEFAERDLVWPA